VCVAGGCRTPAGETGSDDTWRLRLQAPEQQKQPQGLETGQVLPNARVTGDTSQLLLNGPWMKARRHGPLHRRLLATLPAPGGALAPACAPDPLPRVERGHSVERGIPAMWEAAGPGRGHRGRLPDLCAGRSGRRRIVAIPSITADLRRRQRGAGRRIELTCGCGKPYLPSCFRRALRCRPAGVHRFRAAAGLWPARDKLGDSCCASVTRWSLPMAAAGNFAVACGKVTSRLQRPVAVAAQTSAI
jgi:hypothetical protein